MWMRSHTHKPYCIYPVMPKIASLQGVSLWLTLAWQMLHLVAFKHSGKCRLAFLRASEPLNQYFIGSVHIPSLQTSSWSFRPFDRDRYHWWMLLLVFHAHFNMYSNKFTALASELFTSIQIKKKQQLFHSPRSVDVILGRTQSSCHMTVDTWAWMNTTYLQLTHKHKPWASFCRRANRRACFSSVFVFFLVQCFRHVAFIFPPTGLSSSGLRKKKNICMSSSLGHRYGFWKPFSSSRAALCCLIRETKTESTVPSFVPEEPSCSHYILPTSGNS